jgi:hypothetical protein
VRGYYLKNNRARGGGAAPHAGIAASIFIVSLRE